MAIAGFGKTQIRYDMFDIARSAKEARRLGKCERLYHRGQEMAWDGKAILPMLLEKHGGIHVSDEKKEALKRVFAIIMWGELAAWKISAQLADGLIPLEAKMAATSQSFDEARHFYVMHDYLTELGYMPERMGRAPQALLDLVLETPNLAYKLLGMQLMIEPIALTIFQTVRETEVEPVLCELMRYYERDEARHVGLGMQYLPSFIQDMSRAEVMRMVTFQVRVLTWAVWELKVIEEDFKVLGVDPRAVLDRGKKKQLAALHEAFNALGIDWQQDKNYAAATLNGVIELLFPTDETKNKSWQRMQAAYKAFWGRDKHHDKSEFDAHNQHVIQTVYGLRGEDETTISNPSPNLSAVS